ncbi:hypothetical protein [Streptomyces graminofaciens]|uniref:hypothetical protein n=1 Tax=Streptomyces graminofaciens TaxID=68212 RepID=UPI002573864D|nr:hypothetical protein [Streptomyces graminofaciens]
MAHALFGGVAVMAWLLLPAMTDPPVPPEAKEPRAAVTQPKDDGSSGTDLVLPVALLGAAGAAATYSYVRRKRRTEGRTTPAPSHAPAAGLPEEPLPVLDQRSLRALLETDDCVRTSAEELRFAAARSGPEAAEPYSRAVAYARAELAKAFRLRQRLDETSGTAPDDERTMLQEIVARCADAQSRLDSAAPGLDQLRALEREMSAALECAETRFRELTGRTATAATTLAELRERYDPAVSLPVAGHVEQAKDRLVFATVQLNRARQALDRGEDAAAAVCLRAAEGAVDQADVFVSGVERLAGEPPATAGTTTDPLLAARAAVAAAADYVTTHRGAVATPARTRLAEAERCLTAADHAEHAEPPENTDAGPDSERALTLAQEARQLAERDVRSYGNPYGGPVVDGLGGALLGGIVLGEAPGGGRSEPRGPACFGGTATRGRRTTGGHF